MYMNTKSLSYDCIEAMPQNFDWMEERGEDLEGWRVVVPSDALDSEGNPMDPWYDNGGSDDAARCKECGWKGCPDNWDGKTIHICPECGEQAIELYDCPTEQAHEPMMNYYYPVEFRGDEAEAAQAVRDAGALALIELRDGSYVMALTGDGMDFTWDIVRGYVALGLYPPARFASQLPRFAGYDKDALDLIEASRYTLEAMRDRALRGLERLRDLAYEVEEDLARK